MNIKVYLNDWFYNAGITGFLRIIEHNKANYLVENKANYIEFDSEILRDFHKYYFNYFFDKYDVAKFCIEITKSAFEYLIANIESDEKDVKEKIKSNKKFIKETIKKQLDKIKKIDENTYNTIKEAYDQLDKEANKTGIEQIRTVLLENLNKKHINERLTLNLFKSKLSNTYFRTTFIFKCSENSTFL